jgi:hypothetical protein
LRLRGLELGRDELALVGEHVRFQPGARSPSSRSSSSIIPWPAELRRAAVASRIDVTLFSAA